jgi:hypothetical protein
VDQVVHLCLTLPGISLTPQEPTLPSHFGQPSPLLKRRSGPTRLMCTTCTRPIVQFHSKTLCARSTSFTKLVTCKAPFRFQMYSDD